MIHLEYAFTKEHGRVGFRVTQEALGRVATIYSIGGRWDVHPYTFPMHEQYGAFGGAKGGFVSLEAAKAFCLAIAHDMVALRKGEPEF